MTNFDQSSVTGTRYQRAFEVVCSNRRGQLPVITFKREYVVEFDGETLAKEIQPVSQVLLPENAATTFPLRDPVTGEIIPDKTATFQDVYTLLYSLFIDRASAFDAAQASLNISS